MKIVHLADLHLGYKAYNRLNENGFNLREIDVFEAFREALRKIVEINPDLIIFAGDVFHRPRPSNLTIYQTISRLKAFRKHCAAPIFIISGNHESTKLRESGNILNILEATIPDIVVVDGEIQGIEFNKLDAYVLGVPYNALLKSTSNDFKPNKNFKHNIMAIHGSYDSVKCPEIKRYDNDALIKDSDINESEWDYIAFGHYHTFTELAPNCYYSGSIERTSTNIWKEAKEKKGFIEFDLDKKECRFHSLKSPRNVVDIKKIDADKLTGEELNQKIIEEMAKIPDLDKSIVRLNIENLDQVTLKSIDFKKIRELKRAAIHFRANFIKKNASVIIDEKGETITKRKGLLEYLEEELETFELNQELNKVKFTEMAKEYLLQETSKT